MTSVSIPVKSLDLILETLTKIEGMPIYSTLRVLQDTLKSNATSEDTTLGGGKMDI